MSADPRSLKPGELCQLLNSTPLGAVIDPVRLRRHRDQAGLRIGDGKRIDLVRYAAWLRGRKKSGKQDQPSRVHEAALAVAASQRLALQDVKPEAAPLTPKQQRAIAALLSEPTRAAAADKAGVARGTLYRWLERPNFRDALQRAQRELLRDAQARIQAGTGEAVETLLDVMRGGAKDADRIRAAKIVLETARLEAAPSRADRRVAQAAPLNADELERLLSEQLMWIGRANLPEAERTRLTVALSAALLKARSAGLIERRLQELESVLQDRERRRA